MMLGAGTVTNMFGNTFLLASMHPLFAGSIVEHASVLMQMSISQIYSDVYRPSHSSLAATALRM